MSDLYESEDMSSFLQILLQNTSSSAAAADVAAAGGLFGGGGAAASFNFSDPGGCFFAGESDGGGVNPSSSRVLNLASNCEVDQIEGPDQASDVPMNHAPPRSLKRSRAAEVHNMSEKRRRSRINEKLKALQTLIPNSNKTDKASMLDEAIEYLKQLQLQVQMLTMRNGLSLHPGYSVGSLQSTLAPSAGLQLDEGNALLNANRGANTLSRDHQDVFMQSVVLEPTNHNASTLPMLMPSSTRNATNLDIPPSFAPPMDNRYGLLNHLASTKDICRDDTLARLQLDISCSGNASSPGVSSS